MPTKLKLSETKTQTAFFANNLQAIKERLPDKGRFVYEFARHLARTALLTHSETLSINDCVYLIKRLLLEKYLDDLMVNQTFTKKYSVAEYIFESLEEILRHSLGPFMGTLVMDCLKRDEQLKQAFANKAKYEVQ
jgi:hypothetical protein